MGLLFGVLLPQKKLNRETLAQIGESYTNSIIEPANRLAGSTIEFVLYYTNNVFEESLFQRKSHVARV